MTVKQLIRKLNKLPEDYDIVIENHHAYVVGTYKTYGIQIDDDMKSVSIMSDYAYVWNFTEGKWER